MRIMIRNIALVAHDARKLELVSWVKFNAGSLKDCTLYCTGTTGRLIGDRVDMLVFFCDNLIMQGHQNDVMSLVRLASLYNVPFATNRSTADFIISSPLYRDPDYVPIIPSCIESYKNRKL